MNLSLLRQPDVLELLVRVVTGRGHVVLHLGPVDDVPGPPEARHVVRISQHDLLELVDELEKIVLGNAYYMPGLWWTRNVVHWAKVKNYVAPPSHYTNQKLQDVWLAEE